MYTLNATGVHGVAQPMVLMDQGGSVMNVETDMTGTLRRETHGHEPIVMQSMAVRRLTPVECERLQGFPDTYTDIMSKGKATPDGPRYKALGNSMAVPVMAWIGKRINEVEELCKPNK
jgi:DNA (cytosine-5)-methyltransferase 1